MPKPEFENATPATIRVALVKALPAGIIVPGVPVDGSAVEIDRVYAKGYLDAGLIKEVVESSEAPRPVKIASVEEGV